MESNLILAGVGGQGILTIAKAISIAALHRGLQLKQAEVHGMSQRGGAVQSHLRVADKPLSSDLIPFGGAHMVVAVEPLESLRYVQYLREDGVVVASTNAFINIPNYPPIEDVLERVSRVPNHVLLDADRLSKMAGSGRSANIVMFGAASLYLDIDPVDLENAVGEMFSKKGERIIEMNRLAFWLGRNAGQAYLDGLERGGTSAAVRQWIDGLTLEQLSNPEGVDANEFGRVVATDQLTSAEANAFEASLLKAYQEDRRPLYEHEVYALVELVGAITPPKYIFVPKGGGITDTTLDLFPGDKVVLKLVSPDVIHKTEAKAVAFVPRTPEAVQHEMERMYAQHAAARIEGVLIVEFIERTEQTFGNELFVGVRATREFGPVIAAGIGGVDTEYLAQRMRPGLAVAKAVATDTSAEQFLDLFKTTAAYELMSGQVRGHRRIVSDGELLRCFRAFISIARRFCLDRGEEGPDVAELEVNPFAFRQQRLVPLDGRGRLGPAVKTPPARPIEKINNLIEPKSIAILGVSAKSKKNFGRVILNNVQECGFPADHLYIIKDGETEIDGAKCYASIQDVPEPIDMLVTAVPAGSLPQVIDEIAASDKVRSVILIPGGVGETEGTEDLKQQTRDAIRRAHERPDGGPVFVGPNSMGIQSRIGKYDTFFIPRAKLDNRMSQPARRVAIISQSGAFIITRLSNLEMLDPALALSIGNQLDTTLSDYVRIVGRRDDIDVIGVYAEGFNDTDGLAFLKAVEEVTAAGKRVVFYKAGRTESGRSAAAGHTASVAGDYDICQAASEMAGAIVVETFKQFEQVLEVATALHDKPVDGVRIGAMSNAGFETVGMADTVRGVGYSVKMAKLTDASREKLVAALGTHKLDALVNARNPLDVTPMASDQAYEDCVRVLVDAPEVDAVIVSCVPLSPAILTTPDEITKGGSLGERIPKLFGAANKPLVAVIECGPLYDPLVQMIRAGGVPVFRSCDDAMRALGRYLCHRAPQDALAATPVDAPLEDVVPQGGAPVTPQPAKAYP